jgi:alanine racemase
MSANVFAGAELSIDLDAIAANWCALDARLAGGARAGAVVKADAYGLGMAEVAPALLGAGCGDFFTATLDEGIALRALLAARTAGAARAAGEACRIYVFFGPRRGEAAEYSRHRLIPILNDLGQIETWRAEPGGGGAVAVALHIDTGMSRLGLPADEVARLAGEPERLAGLDIALAMSHLACAEEPEQAMNGAQLGEFEVALGTLGPAMAAAKSSLANSSGIFLGPQFHFDLARPGVALYGVNPTPGKANPMSEVVRLQGKILQLRNIESGRSIGYGATHKVTRPSRIATVPVGYADGYLRSASSRANVYINGVQAPVVGRVSMDMITLDVTDIPAQHAQPGASVDLIGGPHPVDALAAEAGTIGYEILTSLGQRYRRRYLQNAADR